MGFIYKPGQGRYTRISTGVFLGLFAGFGCSSLYKVLDMTALSPMARKFVPVGVFLGLVAVIAVLMNWRKLADFLIETETEMIRVIWPSRREVIASSLVVIITVVVMAAFLHGADWLLLKLLEGVGLY
jgi:preprotein translocase SecE subunit